MVNLYLLEVKTTKDDNRFGGSYLITSDSETSVYVKAKKYFSEKGLETAIRSISITLVGSMDNFMGEKIDNRIAESFTTIPFIVAKE